MEIQSVSIIGLGALGVMFGRPLSEHLPEGKLKFIADAERIARYRQDGVYANGEPVNFHFAPPTETGDPSDLIIFAVKYPGLMNAIEAVKNQIGPNTIIISLLNGISSEEIIGRELGMHRMLLTVAQGMDAMKVGNRLTYTKMGHLCIGDPEPGAPSEKARAVANFFEKNGVPYELCEDTRHRLWSKFMLNTGLNQTIALYGCGYQGILREGEPRDLMLSAMREVIRVSEPAGVRLTEADLQGWMPVLASLKPDGKPSMRQDVEASRPTEVDYFAGTVLELGRKYAIPCPVNQMLYDRIKEMERGYLVSA